MKIINLNNSAFTLLETLLAAIIFIVSIVGVFVTLDALRKPVLDKESALSAAVFGKQVLEALRSQVDARTYYNDCLNPDLTNAVNPDGSCGAFSLYLNTHEVATTSSTWPTGLSWPSNSLANANNSILNYTVSCADGSAPSGSPLDCGNPDSARRVDLNISWTNAP